VYKHILLPFNGSEPSLKAEKECLDFARSIGARVTILHVIRHRRLMIEDGHSTDLVKDLEEEYDIGAKRGAWEMLQEVERRARANGVECSSVVVFGNDPHEEIIRNAVRRSCDLVMMAARLRRFPKLLAQRGETDRVLSRSTISVLVVR
jgi:nucleotide-binding universal stress UspA family protein